MFKEFHGRDGLSVNEIADRIRNIINSPATSNLDRNELDTSRIKQKHVMDDGVKVKVDEVYGDASRSNAALNQIQDDEPLELTNKTVNYATNNGNEHDYAKKSSNTEHQASQSISHETSEMLQNFKNKLLDSKEIQKLGCGRTLEELIVELIEPYITSWLDRHFPALVKEVLERELKRFMKE